jgi:repressor LexA
VTPDPTTLFERIQFVLHLESVPRIAEKMGLVKQSVYDWQKGKMPSLDTLIQIAKLGGASLHWLILGEGPMRIDRATELAAGEVPIFLGPREHQEIQKLAAISGRTFEDEARELILTELKARGLVKDRVETSNIVFFGDHVPRMVDMRLLGTIAAGAPIEVFAEAETVRVPQDFDRSGKQMFVLRVQGESMIDEGIRDGDYIVCESTRTALSGQTVVAVIDGEKATVKNYYPERGRIRLQPANEKHEAIFITDDRLDIQGIVVGLWRPPQ